MSESWRVMDESGGDISRDTIGISDLTEWLKDMRRGDIFVIEGADNE